MALENNCKENEVKFALDHVWKIIKDPPAFRSQYDYPDIARKKTRTFELRAINTSSTQNVSVDFELNEEILPFTQKAAKRKAKKKAYATYSRYDANNDLKQNLDTIVNSLAELKCMKKIDVELRQAEVEMKRARSKEKKRERQLKLFTIIQRDTSNMTPEQHYFHNIQCEEAKAALQSSP